MTNLSENAIATLREHEDTLEDLAAADLPISWAAAAYLDALREAEGRGGDGDGGGGDGGRRC